MDGKLILWSASIHALCLQLSQVLPCWVNGGVDVSMGKGHFWNTYILLTCTCAILDCYFSEERKSPIKLLANLMVDINIEVDSLMREASNSIGIFFSLSVNPFLVFSVLNLGFWLFCTGRQLLFSMQSMAACTCSKSFFMQGLLWPPCILAFIRGRQTCLWIRSPALLVSSWPSQTCMHRYHMVSPTTVHSTFPHGSGWRQCHICSRSTAGGRGTLCYISTSVNRKGSSIYKHLKNWYEKCYSNTL